MGWRRLRQRQRLAGEGRAGCRSPRGIAVVDTEEVVSKSSVAVPLTVSFGCDGSSSRVGA